MIAKVLDADFASNPSLTGHTGPGYSCARGSWATVLDSGNVVRVVGDDQPRFPGATLVQNWAQLSEDLASWAIKSNATVVDDVVTAPNGVMLSSITDDATAGLHHVKQPNQINSYFTLAGRYRLHSCYVKGGTGRYVMLQDAAWSNAPRVNIFDTQTGTWVYKGTFYDADSFGVESIGAGVYRIWFITSQPNAAYDEECIGIANGTDYTDASYSGSGSTVYAGGMMIEIVDALQTTPGAYIQTGAMGAYTSIAEFSGTNDGLFTEPAATNLCLESEDFTSAQWTKTFTTINADGAEGPNAAMTMDEIVDDGGGGSTTNCYIQQTFTNTGEFIISGYGAPSALDWIFVETSARGTLVESAYFNLNTGAVGTNLGANNVNQGCYLDGNGLYRWWIKLASDADAAWNVRIHPANGDGDHNVARDGTSSVYVTAVQVENGAARALPTSYIPTTTATVTRAADNVTADSMTWFPQSAGSFYHKSTPYFYDNDSTSVVIFLEARLNGVQYNPFSCIDVSGTRTGYADYRARNSLAEEVSTETNSHTSGTVSETALGYDWNQDKMRLSVNGSAVASDDAATTTEPVPTTFTVGNSQGLSGGPVLTNRIIVYDDLLSDAELQDLSQGTLPTFGRDLMDYSLTFPLTGSLPIVPTYRWDYE